MTKITENFLKNNLIKIIQKDYPVLKIKSFKTINNGWDNFVIEINNKFIFRFPKRDELKRFQTEIKVLDYLQGKINLKIPKIIFIGKKYRYTGYEKIIGNSLDIKTYNKLNKIQKEKLVFDIANFFKEIHSVIPIEKAESLGVQKENMPQYAKDIKSRICKYILDPKILQFISKTLKEYKDILQVKFENGFLFADLHEDNMAFDSKNKKLNGVFDFGDICIGEINREFNYLYRFNKILMEEVIQKYQPQTKRKINFRRAVIYSRVNELSDFATYAHKPKSIVYKNAMRNFNKWVKEMDIYK